MNILTDELPQHIEVCGSKYPINTDFRTWIEFEELLFEGADPKEAFTKAIVLCMRSQGIMKTVLPPSMKETVEALCNFYFCRTAENVEARKAPAGAKRMYSFSRDAELIYAAFLQEYGIDLTECRMHWWKFRALFSALSGDSKLCSVMRIRCADLSDAAKGSSRNRLAKLKAVYALPDFRSEDEREAELGEALW